METELSDIDDEPTAGSDNLVKSEGVWKAESLCIVGNTINLLSPNSNTHILMSDNSETGSVDKDYESWGPISVVSEHTYRLYKKDMTTAFNGMKAKVYNNGSYVQKSNEGKDIVIPSGLTSPRVYLTNFKDASAFNFSECMFVDVTHTVPTAFVPYYLDWNHEEKIEKLDNDINTVISTLTPDVAILKELAIQKGQEKTANIFNYQSPDIREGGFYNDDGVWTANSSFDCLPIPLEAGKTYNRYDGINLSTWSGTNIRVFDGNTMIVKTKTNSIEVPNNAVNPIGYFVFYNESSEHYHDTSNFMVVENTVVITEYLPYSIYSIDDETLINMIENIAEETAQSVEIELVQTTGAATNKAMSQAATTNAITNAVAGLSSTTVEQGKGQSITNPMSQKAVTDLLAELEPENPGYRFAPRPASGYENFFVSVNCSIADDTLSTTAVQDSRDMQQDRCILTLPENYTQNGEPVRLVICGHGTGWKCTAETTLPWAGMNTRMLVKEGYAVLGCNGTPGELNGLDLGHNCVPECYRSILAAYKYVIEKYNIKRDGVLTSGLSMGTYMTGQIALFTEIPVLAQVFYGFSGEIWKAQFTYKTAIRERMCQKFGFIGTAPTFTNNNPPTAAEKQYILDNLDKWSGYDVLLKGLTNKAILSTFNVWPASSTITNSDEDAIYNDAIVVGRPPCKFFVCDDDTTAPKRWSEYMAKMIRNGGGYAEVRHYATGGHNEWGVGDNITFTTKYGGDVTVNGSSYEGLLFLQKFDK